MTLWPLALAIIAGVLRLVFNPGASMSVGWWVIHTAAVVEVGDHILAE